MTSTVRQIEIEQERIDVARRQVVERTLRPGVTDTVAAEILRAARVLGIGGLARVATGQRFVVIDIHEQSLERAVADGHLVVMGDATDDATLRTAGIDRARGLITTIDSDANNVYVTLSARALSPTLFIVARASAPGAEAKLVQAAG